MDKQIKNFADVIGKTIKRTFTNSVDEKLLIVFSDSTFIALEYNTDSYSVDLQVEDYTVYKNLQYAGIISSEEYVQLHNESLKASADAEKERELKELERLIAKYPNTNTVQKWLKGD